MSSRLYLSIFSFLLTFQSLVSISHAWEGVVVRVVDGDTLIVAPKDANYPELLGISVRLYGIDAPELAQPGGQESKSALERLAHQGAAVDIIPVEADRYDRAVGVVMLDGMSLNIEQIRHGQAWVYAKYCKARFRNDWQRIERQARASKSGLWHESVPIPPWEWRTQQNPSGKSARSSRARLSLIEQIPNFHSQSLGQRSQCREPASIPPEWILTFFRKLGINPDWLETGTGPMYLRTDKGYGASEDLATVVPEHQTRRPARLWCLCTALSADGKMKTICQNQTASADWHCREAMLEKASGYTEHRVMPLPLSCIEG